MGAPTPRALLLRRPTRTCCAVMVDLCDLYFREAWLNHGWVPEPQGFSGFRSR